MRTRQNLTSKDTQKRKLPVRGLYRYDVRSSLDISDHGGSTRLFLDGATGTLVALWLPTGAAGGDTFITWMSNLHMASVGGMNRPGFPRHF
jgi:hypothetical protein